MVPSRVPPPFNSEDTELIEDELDTLVCTMQQLDFEDPRIKKKVNEMAQAIWTVG